MPNIDLIYGNDDIKIGKNLKIIHFNDVYNIEGCQNEPKAGAARFINAIEDILKLDDSTIILFSGDAISPSNSMHKFFIFTFFSYRYMIFKL